MATTSRRMDAPTVVRNEELWFASRPSKANAHEVGAHIVRVLENPTKPVKRLDVQLLRAPVSPFKGLAQDSWNLLTLQPGELVDRRSGERRRKSILMRGIQPLIPEGPRSPSAELRVLNHVGAQLRNPPNESALTGAYRRPKGLVVLVFISFEGLPLAAALFGAGEPIAQMPAMVGWGTWIIEHLILCLVLGPWPLARRRDVVAEPIPREATARRAA